MKTAILGLRGKSIPLIIQVCTLIVQMMTGNINFATPTVALSDVSLAIKALSDAYQAALNGGKPLKATQQLNKAALLTLMAQLRAYVQDVSGGDQTIILSSGMAIKSLPSPKSIPPMVDNLRLKNNVASGQASLLWNALKRVDAYSVQMSQTPADETSWTDVGMSTKRSITLTGLPGTTLCWFRVAGFNAAGLGAWSSPVQKVIS